MSRDEHRRRIPTSEELERQGAVAPTASETPDGRRGLFGFLRVGRIRVSGEVAARKYVPSQRRTDSPDSAGIAEQPLSQESPVAFSSGPERTVAASERPATATDSGADPRTESSRESVHIAPRRIRIDASVRDRRGIGRHGTGS
jgi:hypothetical protein